MSAPAQFEQTSVLTLILTANCSRSQKVSWLHITSRNSMMGQLLCATPVKIFEISLYYLLRFTHFRGLNPNAEVNVIRNMVLLLQVRQWLRILIAQRDLTSFQSINCNNPWWNSADSVFRCKRTQRNVLPRLKISKTPVIQ